MLKLYVSNQVLPKRSGGLFLFTDPQAQIKLFFNEIYITLNKILGKYDNILLAGDLNINELKSGSDSSNRLSDPKESSTLQTWLRNLLVLNRKMEFLLT